jgi:parallel beta-helix repeat protein
MPSFRPSLELLEQRTVLSASFGLAFLGPASFGPTHVVEVVHPGESIQAAVNHAPVGAEIDVLPGTYSESVTVATQGIHLVGLHDRHGAGVILVNPGGAANGITVTAAGAGFELREFTVRSFDDNGVVLNGVNGFVLSHVTTTDNGDYGLFPVHSTHGTIVNCTASGHRDTGIYVGQSSDIAVLGNTTFANVSGIEIENCTRVRVVGNDSHDNTAGLAVFLLPGLSVTASSDILVAGNFIHDNNHPNFGDPGDEVSFLPPGTGILVLGADRVTVVGNRVTGNDTVGIGVASTLLLGVIAGLPPEAFAGIEPNPDGVRVLGNWVKGNGHAPAIAFLPGADLLWDGSGTGNWWAWNAFDTSFPLALPRHP